MLLVAALVACAAATNTAGVSTLHASVPVTYRRAVRPSRDASFWRLRGGLRELKDREEWEELQAEARDMLLVVDFTATWCGPCQRIAPAFAAIADEYAESAVFVKIDVRPSCPSDQLPCICQCHDA